MSLSRTRCAPSTWDLGFFFDREHAELAEQVRQLAVHALRADEDLHAALPPPTFEDLSRRVRALALQLSAHRILHAAVPAAWGGLAIGRRETVDVRALCVVRETLAWASPLAEFVFAMQGLGSYPIVFAGTDAQRAEFLPPVLRGTSLAAFAITETEAGSDVASMKSVARREGDGYVLDGDKTFISNAGIAGHYVVFARTSPDQGSRGITAFVVRPEDPGFEFGGARALVTDHPVGSIRMRGLHVPASRRLGAEGQGFRIAMATLDVFRSTVGAAAVGMARRALDDSLTHVTTRTQFGQPLADFQLTRAALAEMATDLDAARLLVFRAAHARDSGAERVTLEASMAKLFATEAAQRIVDRAVQLHGGLGVTRGASVERLYRDVRALRIYEGTSEVQKLVIAGVLVAGERARPEEPAATTSSVHVPPLPPLPSIMDTTPAGPAEHVPAAVLPWGAQAEQMAADLRPTVSPAELPKEILDDPEASRRGRSSD